MESNGTNAGRKKGYQMEETVVICGANSYEGKYYLNPVFKRLPQSVQDELKILCVLFTHEIGGIMTLELDEDRQVQIRTKALENDFAFDEIGSVLKAKELQREHEELFRSLSLYYQVFAEGLTLEEE